MSIVQKCPLMPVFQHLEIPQSDESFRLPPLFGNWKEYDILPDHEFFSPERSDASVIIETPALPACLSCYFIHRPNTPRPWENQHVAGASSSRSLPNQNIT